MARFEMPELMPAGLGEGAVTADTMFELGMMYASGREVPIDLITAHKWFNVAAMKGHAEAAQLRREIAAEMKDAEIGQAQRAARDWTKAHPEPVVQQALVLRVAAYPFRGAYSADRPDSADSPFQFDAAVWDL